MSDDFAWDQADVVIHEQPTTAVYLNPRGQIVIRQQRWPDEDQFVFISPEFADPLARAIVGAAGLSETVSEGFAEPSAKASTLRSRRFRQRQRNAQPEGRNAAGNAEPDTENGALLPMKRAG